MICVHLALNIKLTPNLITNGVGAAHRHVAFIALAVLYVGPSNTPERTALSMNLIVIT